MSASRIPGRGFVALVHKEWRDTRGLWLVLACAGPLLLDLLQRFYREEMEYGPTDGWVWSWLVTLSAIVLITECFARDERSKVGATLGSLPVRSPKLLLAKSFYVVVSIALLTSWMLIADRVRGWMGGPRVEAVWHPPVLQELFLLGSGCLACVLFSLVFRQALMSVLATGFLMFGIAWAAAAIGQGKIVGLVPALLSYSPGLVFGVSVVLALVACLVVYRPGSSRGVWRRSFIAASVFLGPVLPAMGFVSCVDWPVPGQIGCWSPSPSGRYVVLSETRATTALFGLPEHEGRFGVLDTFSGHLIDLPDMSWFAFSSSRQQWTSDEKLLLYLPSYREVPIRSGRFEFDLTSPEIVRHLDEDEWKTARWRNRGTRWGVLNYSVLPRDGESVWIAAEVDVADQLGDRWKVLHTRDVIVGLSPERGTVFVNENSMLERRDLLSGCTTWSVPLPERFRRPSASPDGQWLKLEGPNRQVLIFDAHSGDVVAMVTGWAQWSKIPGRILEVEHYRGWFGEGGIPCDTPKRRYWLTSDWEEHTFDPPGVPMVWLDEHRLILCPGEDYPGRCESTVLQVWDRRTNEVKTLRDLAEVYP